MLTIRLNAPNEDIHLKLSLMFRRFIIFSGFAAAVNLTVAYILYGVMGFDEGRAYALSVSLAFLAGMAVSFFLNRRFTYLASGRPVVTELRDFLLVSVGGMTLTTALAWSLDTHADAVITRLVDGLLLPETVAHVCAVGLTAVYSFFAHKFISFRAKPSATGTSI